MKSEDVAPDLNRIPNPPQKAATVVTEGKRNKEEDVQEVDRFVWIDWFSKAMSFHFINRFVLDLIFNFFGRMDYGLFGFIGLWICLVYGLF